MVSVLLGKLAQHPVDVGVVIFCHLLCRVDKRQSDYLVHQHCHLACALLHHGRYMLALFCALGHVGVGYHLCKTRDDVQWCAHLVGHILYEGRLHLLRFHSLDIGFFHLHDMLLAHLYDIGHRYNQQHQQEDDGQQSVGAVQGLLVLILKQLYLVLNTMHAV